MQTLKDIAQQAPFAAMQPGQFTDARILASSGLTVEQQVDQQAFERAVNLANAALAFRGAKAGGGYAYTPGQWEGRARKAERKVREIALQSEIILQRRAEATDADRAMLGIMLGVAS